MRHVTPIPRPRRPKRRTPRAQRGRDVEETSERKKRQQKSPEKQPTKTLKTLEHPRNTIINNPRKHQTPSNKHPKHHKPQQKNTESKFLAKPGQNRPAPSCIIPLVLSQAFPISVPKGTAAVVGAVGFFWLSRLKMCLCFGS